MFVCLCVCLCLLLSGAGKMTEMMGGWIRYLAGEGIHATKRLPQDDAWPEMLSLWRLPGGQGMQSWRDRLGGHGLW